LAEIEWNCRGQWRASACSYLRAWASHDFVTWTERLRGKEASIQILLPPAAVAFGMTIFGLVFNFTVPNLG
jgi:hypothetical protein